MNNTGLRDASASKNCHWEGSSCFCLGHRSSLLLTTGDAHKNMLYSLLLNLILKMSKKSVTIVKESVTHFAQQLAEQWLSPWSWSLGLRNCCHPCFSVLVTKFNVAQGIVYLISEEPFSQECHNDQCGHQKGIVGKGTNLRPLTFPGASIGKRLLGAKTQNLRPNFQPLSSLWRVGELEKKGKPCGFFGLKCWESYQSWFWGWFLTDHWEHPDVVLALRVGLALQVAVVLVLLGTGPVDSLKGKTLLDWKWKQYWNESESEKFKLPVTSRFAETENSFEFWVLRGSGLLWLEMTVVIS